MRFDSRIWSTAFRRLSGLMLGVSLLIFLGASTASVKAWLGVHGAGIIKAQTALVFLCLLLSGVLFVFARALGTRRHFQDGPPGRLVPHRSFPAVTILIAGVILIRVLLGLYGPMEDDEIILAVELPQNSVAKILTPSFGNSLVGKNQTVSVLSAYLFTDWFGLNEITYRVPAVLYALLTLVVLLAFRKQVNGFSTVLVFGNLLVNELALWYMHNAKGYVSMLPFTLTLLFILISREQQASWNKTQRFLFGLALILTPLTNAFGALFVGFLSVAWAMWMVLHEKKLSQKEWERGGELLKMMLWALPLVVLVLFNQATHMDKEGDLLSGRTPDYYLATAYLFGMGFDWQSKLLVLLAGALLFLSRKTLRYLDFISVFGLVSLFLIAFLILTLNPAWAFERYYFVFLIPILLWLGERTACISHRGLRRSFQMMVLALLVGGPFLSREIILDRYTARHQPVVSFVHEVRKKTAPVSAHCYSVEGDAFYVQMIQSIYLNDAVKAPMGSHECRRSFVLLLKRGHWTAGLGQLPQSLRETVDEMYEDPQGFVLYEWRGREKRNLARITR